tara:strand:- start:445 stop:2094 length:1650 start_codon:yes stop_codon:yes gene_type:complete
MTFLKNLFIYFRYKRFNKLHFKKNNFPNSENLILIEFNRFKTFHVSVAIIANILAKKFKANMACYPEISFHKCVDGKQTLKNKLFFFLGNILKTKDFGIFYSFGVKKIFNVPVNSPYYEEALRIKKRYIKKIKTKDNLLKFKLNNILIGDLIYDSYLKYYKKETVNISHVTFSYFFQKSIEYYLFWFYYFKKNNVKAVITPQASLLSALPLRLAIYFSSKAIVADQQYLFQLNKNRIYPHKQWLDFQKDIKRKDVKKNISKGLELAKKRLMLRFAGQASVDIPYIYKSPYKKKNNLKNMVLKKNNRLKILIAPHSFVDAPHAIGNHLFADYYEWLIYILKLSKMTKYDWYIKCHPNFYNRNQDPSAQIVESLCKEYKNVKYLDQTTSHYQIISEKIDYVITCNGTIAMEYPYLGIPAINGSMVTPYNFKFNYNPKTIKELKMIILNLKKKKFKVNRKKILEIYFLRHIYYSNDWLYENMNELIQYCKEWQLVHINPAAYEFFLERSKSVYSKQKYDALKRFVNSKDYMFTFNHLGINLSDQILSQKKIY